MPWKRKYGEKEQENDQNRSFFPLECSISPCCSIFRINFTRNPQPVVSFRPTEIILVTTLLDPKRYPKAKLAQLYQLRWLATVVNFKHLKTTLKMEMILAKTPEMVQKEIWVQMLAYNLLRTLMWQAAQQTAVSPLRISEHCTRQQFNHFRPQLAHTSAQDRRRLYSCLLNVMTEQLVPLRPHRHEPRVSKRRPKSFPRMQQPRSILKAKLAA